MLERTAQSRYSCNFTGDCLKLRAVHRRELEHLVDCVVFAAAGKYAAPSLSSGGKVNWLRLTVFDPYSFSGDLDGDKFTVIWDPDLIPKVIAEVGYLAALYRKSLTTAFPALYLPSCKDSRTIDCDATGLSRSLCWL